MPRVSVIMAALNAAAFIDKAIASVLSQGCSDWELIVVDGGSTDGTGEVISRIPDPRIRCIRQSDPGLGAARNQGTAQSSAQYLAFLDADDWWEPDCLRVLSRALDDHPRCAVAHGDWSFADTDCVVHGRQSSTFAYGEGLKSLVLFNPIAVHAALVRRSALLAVGGFPEQAVFHEDWGLWLRLAAAGHRFVHIPQVVAYYRWRPGSLSKDAHRAKASRLATLQWLWAPGTLPAALHAARARSYSTAYVDFCVSQFAIGDLPAALQELDTALAYDGAAASAVDTYYRIAFANDPAGLSLDEPAARVRIQAVLAHLSTLLSEAELSGCRHAAHHALGLACYRCQAHAAARRHMLKALRHKPSSLLARDFSASLARILLPAKAIQVVRQVKGSVRPRHGMKPIQVEFEQRSMGSPSDRHNG